MSQDGSSSRSYIKHPTEKARLDNLAFTSFPEDYLPYTSPSYQKKAPYLVWDDGSSKFRAKRRQFCRSCCCCGTAALASAIALLVAAILAIVAVSVYLGVVTNLFRSPILSISGRFRVIEGDDFEEALLNITSYEFITKAEYYKTLVENVILSSSLESTFIATRIYAFRPGSLLAFFRVHLDRRKIDIDDSEIILAAKNLFIEEAIMAPKPSFDNLILDLPSIDIREYGDEEWLTQDSGAQPGGTHSLKQKHGFRAQSMPNEAVPSPSPDISSHIITSSKIVPFTTSSSKSSLILPNTRASNRPSSSFSSSSTTPVTIRISGKGDGSVGYAEWKPVELPDPIKVSSLGLSSPEADKKDKKQPIGGSVTTFTDNVAQADKSRPHTNNAPKQPPQPNVSSIMSSVSLMILPNSKNKSLTVKENTGVGVVRAVNPNEEPDMPPAEELRKNSRIDKNPLFSPETRRIDLASFRLLNLDDDDEELPTEDEHSSEDQENSNVKIINLGKGDVFPVSLEGNVAETENMDAEVSGESLSSGYFQSHDSTDKFSTDEYSSTPPILGSKDYFSGSDETEVSTPSDFQTSNPLPDESIEGHTFVAHSPLIPQLSLNESSNTEDNLFLITVEIESTTGTTLKVENLTESYSNYTTLKTIEAFAETIVDDSNFKSESTDGSSFVSSIVNLIETVKTTVSEDYETIDLFTSSSFESENVTPNYQDHAFNHHFTILNHSVSQTIYQTLENKGQAIVENSTDQIIDVAEDFEYENSSVNPDAVILGLSQSNLSIEETSDLANLSTELNENSSISSFPQLLGFRKIVRPFKNSPNRNDINDKNNFDDDIFYSLKLGFPPTISSVSTSSQAGSNFTSPEEDDNAIRGVSTPIPPSFSTTNSSLMPNLRNPPVISCSGEEFLCRSGECVPEDYHCNMRRDCKDNSDERYCSCAEYLTVIGQSQKICDGVEDCWDLSDEAHCPWCAPGQFLCQTPLSKLCINMSQVCDGVNDCPFATDERQCVKLAHNENDNPRYKYSSEGFLMVRKDGRWGKLCLDSLNDVARKTSAKLKVDDLGRVVCTALTYRDVNETVQVLETADANQTFFELEDQPLKSNVIFKESECRSKDVVHVKCQSLECGFRPLAVSALRRRIVGGQSTGSGSWPWQAALYKEGEFQCGAVIVSDTWLISAGHCFFSTQTAYWTARMGILRRGTELPAPSEQVRRIVNIILHPDYVDKGFINDIVLLKLEKPVHFSDYLRPLCLPLVTEDVELWHNQHCSVVGWGKLYEIGHVFPDSLQEVRLPVISTEECRKRIAFLSMYHITENMFCAGFERGGRDACLGDSGGPLMCQRKDGRWVLLGVTSNGDGCGRPGRPGVYTKVTKYLDWIYNIMNDDTITDVTVDKCMGHRCVLGRCVLPHRVCDGRFDCASGSDEVNCSL